MSLKYICKIRIIFHHFHFFTYNNFIADSSNDTHDKNPTWWQRSWNQVNAECATKKLDAFVKYGWVPAYSLNNYDENENIMGRGPPSFPILKRSHIHRVYQRDNNALLSMTMI